MSLTYHVTYRNEGKPERTPSGRTLEEARADADILRFQGATSVRVQRDTEARP